MTVANESVRDWAPAAAVPARSTEMACSQYFVSPSASILEPAVA